MNQSAEILTARREYERGQVDNLSRVIANTSDSMRLYLIAFPYLIGILALSAWIVIAYAFIGDVVAGEKGIKLFLVGMALPVLLVIIGIVVMLVIEVAHEWDRARAIRERIRALGAFAPLDDGDSTLPEFPPRWFVEFLRDYYSKFGRLPTIDAVNQHRHAQDNEFNRDIAQRYFQALVAWGAIEGREPHGKSAGIPTQSWEWMLDRAT